METPPTEPHKRTATGDLIIVIFCGGSILISLVFGILLLINLWRL